MQAADLVPHRHAHARSLTMHALQLQEPSWVINRQKADCFFVAVEETYKQDNAYHNSMHAADVAQAAMIILKAGRSTVAFSKLEIFSLIIAAAVHDLGHPGYTNDFLINTQHPNAIVYNDRSVNENFHVSSAFRIVTQSEEANIFSGMLRKDFVQVSCGCTFIQIMMQCLRTWGPKLLTTCSPHP